MTEATFSTSAQAHQPLRGLLWLAALPVVGMLGFGVGIASGLRGDDVWVLGTAILTALVGLLPLLLDQLRPPERRQILISVLSLGFVIYFVVPIFTTYFFGDPYASGRSNLVNILPRDILRGQLAALTGIVAMLVAYSLPLGRGLGNLLPKPRFEWSHGAALAVALIMIPVGWFIFLTGQAGLIPRRLGTGVLGTIAGWYSFGFAVLTLTYLRYRSGGALLLLVLMIPPTMALSFFTGSKKMTLSPLVLVALTHVVITRRLRTRWLVGGILLLVLLYPFAQFYRDVLLQGNRLRAVQVLRDPGRTLSLLGAFLSSAEPAEYLATGIAATSDRLNAMGVLSLIVRETPDVVPFQHGWSIGYVFLGFVPRIVWPGKPKTTAIGQWITENYTAPGTGVQSNTGPSWIGEFYVNFGYPGIIIGMTLFGIYFRLLQTYLFAKNATIPVLLTGVITLYASTLSIGGGIISPINKVMFNAFPILALHVAVRAFSRPTRSLPRAPI